MPRQISVLFITNQLEHGGAEHFMLRLAGQVTGFGHRARLLAGAGKLEDIVPPGVEFVRAPSRAKSPAALYRFVDVLRQDLDVNPVDVIHVNSPSTALAAWLARERRRIPIVGSAHGPWRPWLQPHVARMFGSTCDMVVSCADSVSDILLRAGLEARKAATIHNGIPAETFIAAADKPGMRDTVRAELGVGPRTTLVVAVARLDAGKGLPHLLEAVANLRKTRDCTVAIAGDGPDRAKLEGLARAYGIPGRALLGSRKDVPRVLAAADIFCLPSDGMEGLPLSIAEAMASGLPVVATAVGGVPELVVDGETGWLVPPSYVDCLTDALGAIADSPDRGRQMGRAGRARALERFDLGVMARRFVALYSEMLGARVAA